MSLTIQSGGSITLQGGSGGGGAISAVGSSSNSATEWTISTSANWSAPAGVPSVTVTTGTSALVTVNAMMLRSTGAFGTAFAGFEVTGASSIAPNNDATAVVSSTTAGVGSSAARTLLVTGLTAGSNTFALRFRTDNGSIIVGRTGITVMALA